MPLYAEPRFLPAGDVAVSVELADEISREANARVLTLERLLVEARLPGLVETLPTFRSLLVVYDPLVLAWDALRAASAPSSPGSRGRRRRPAAGSSCPAPTAASTASSSRRWPAGSASTRTRWCASTPGPSTSSTSSASPPACPYMAGLPDRLTIPRLDRPRTKTPQGAWRSAGRQSSIYPVESPGGFWVLGRTPVRLYAPAAGPRSCSGPATAFASGRSTPPSTGRSAPPWRPAPTGPRIEAGRRALDA